MTLKRKKNQAILRRAGLLVVLILATGVLSEDDLSFQKSRIVRDEVFSLKKDQVQYTSIDPNGLVGNDLIFKVDPLTEGVYPQVFLSQKVENPLKNDADWVCGQSNRDTCYIHHSSYDSTNQFHIGIVCPEKDCDVNFKIEITRNIILDNGEEFQLYMLANDTKSFIFTLPQDKSHINSFIVKASAYRGSAKDFELQISRTNFNLEPIDTSYLQGESVWKRGQAIRVTREEHSEYWEKDISFQILLNSNDQGYYHVMAQTEDSTPYLFSQEQRDDLVSAGSRQCYKYFIQSEQSDVHVRVSTYSGSLNIAANSHSIPSTFEEFAFKTEQADLNQIEMSHQNRPIINNTNNGLYYICVYGVNYASYTIKVKEFNPEDTLSLIEDGFTEQFSLKEKTTQAHLYQVPKLSYKGEAIKVEFDLTPISGGDPVIGVKFCSAVKGLECSRDFNIVQFLGKDSGYQKGISTGQIIKVEVNHTEDICNEEEEEGDDCFYQIVVHNNERWSMKYKLSVSHKQYNHILLQESTPTLNSVEKNQSQYYEFYLGSISGVNSVDIILNQLHGDCQVFVSKRTPFPYIDFSEYKEVNSLTKHKYVQVKDRGGDPLNKGKYYIGVHGLTYCTYQLMVLVKRENDSIETIKSVALHEGIPIVHRLQSSSNTFLAHFDADIDEGTDISLIFNLVNKAGRVHASISYNSIPSIQKYDLKIILSQAEIDKNLPSLYHRQGRYYILVYPDEEYARVHQNQYFEFSLTVSYKDSIQHLDAGLWRNIDTSYMTFTFFKHYVMEPNTDIQLLLQSSTSDEQKLYVSVDPKNQEPNKDRYDFSFVTATSFNNAKSLIISSKELTKKNPSCKLETYSSEDICTLYISVLCAEIEGCRSTLEIQYLDKKPKQIFYGSSTFEVADSEQQAFYYYVIVDDIKSKTIVASMEVFQGGAQLAANLQVAQYDALSTGTLVQPSRNKIFTHKGETKLQKQIIEFKEEELFSCINETYGSEQQCIIVFAIFPNMTKDKTTIFEFDVQKELVILKDQYGYTFKANQNEYKYFLYELDCDNCSLHIQIDGYRTDGVYILLNKGIGYPTETNSNFKIKTTNTNYLEINADHDFFDGHPNQMKDLYVIGVMSPVDSRTLTITVTSYSESAISLQFGSPLSVQQEENTTKTYSMFNWHENDIQIEIKVSSGKVDVYAIMESQEEDFKGDELLMMNDYPFSLKGVNSLSEHEDSLILIVKDDRNFCSQCYLSIVIQTGSTASSLQILVKEVASESSISNLLRINSPQMVFINKAEEVRMLRFIIEHDSPFQITVLPEEGSYNLALSLENDIFRAYETHTNPSMITVGTEKFKTEQMQYLFVKALSDQVVLMIKLTQNLETMQLAEGQPQALSFRGDDDLQKNLIYLLPQGNSNVRINMKTQTMGFMPILFYAVVDYSYVESGTFPPSSLYKCNHTSFEDWDPSTSMMSLDLQLSDVKNNQVLIMTLKHNIDYSYMTSLHTEARLRNKGNTSAQLIITASHLEVFKLYRSVEYIQKLKEQKPLYFVTNYMSENATFQILISECYGDVAIDLVRDPQNLNTTRVYHQIEFLYGQKVINVRNAVGVYYVVVSPKSIKFSDQPNLIAEFTIKVKMIQESQIIDEEDLYALDDGKIHYEFMAGTKGNINISWGGIYQSRTGQEPLLKEDVFYKLLFTNERHARMSHQCSLRHVKGLVLATEQLGVLNYYEIKLEEDTHYQFNVFALVQDKMVTLPYDPIDFRIPSKSLFGNGIASIAIGAFMILAVGLGIYYFKKSKSLQKKIDTEIKEFVQVQQNSQLEFIEDPMKLPEQKIVYGKVKNNGGSFVEFHDSDQNKTDLDA